MKLVEISITNALTKKEFTDKRRRRTRTNINSGLFSATYDKKNDPWSVVKTNRELSDENNNDDVNMSNNMKLDFSKTQNIKKQDGYHYYVDLLIKTKVYEENPFFLRVRNIHTVTDKNNLKIYNFDVEKLSNIYQFNKDIIKNYFESLFTVDSSYDNVFNDFNNIEELLYYYLMVDRSQIKDEYLKNALNFLRLNSKKYGLDLHGDNILYRRGKYGMQMVFSDPYGGLRG